MKVLWSLLLFLNPATLAVLIGQDLADHKWRDRLIVLVAQNENAPHVQAQLREIDTLAPLLRERKLVIYVALPDKYGIVSGKFDPASSDWTYSSVVFESLRGEHGTFQLVLIGLDGTIKLTNTEVTAWTDVFATIDAMPMRRAELDNK